MVGRPAGMLVIGAISMLVAVTGLIGSATMISDGLGLTRVGSATSGPTVGTNTAPPPSVESMAARVVSFGVARAVLSLLLVVGAVGTLGVRPSGRRASLVYAVGWILVGGVEPFALRYRFDWPVVASAAYPFLLLAVFNTVAWKAAFAPAKTPDAGVA